MRKAFELGGVIAAAVLIAFGIAAIVMGFNGKSTVNSSLKQEQITGTPDMTPAAIPVRSRRPRPRRTTVRRLQGARHEGDRVADRDAYLLRGPQGRRHR